VGKAVYQSSSCTESMPRMYKMDDKGRGGGGGGGGGGVALYSVNTF
jgi:hypothetical protein